MRPRTTISAPAALLLAGVSLLGGMALRGLTDDHDNRAETSDLPIASDDASWQPGPRGFEDGIPVGFARTEQGAVAAAVAYHSTGQALIDVAPTAVPDAVRRFASAETADQQLAETQAQLRALGDALSAGTGRVRYVQSVLATRVDAYSDDRARVAVWAVGVLWRRGAANPQAGWATSTYDLVWEDDTWKVWTQSTVSGPSPAPNAGMPVDAAGIDRLLSGFDARENRR